MSEQKKVLLSGIKPTGRLHLGNFFGAMRQFVDLQEQYNSSIFIANYHALTTQHDAETLMEDALNIAMDYLAVGLDPQKVTLFLQSDVPEVTELTWVFNCLTTVPYLERAHAFKDAKEKGADVNMGTFDYPVLMAADILIQDADIVPVGKDQKQHLEMARDIAEKFNHTFGDTFTLPEPHILEAVETVVGTDGQKMSKSYNNTIPLFGTDEEIQKAVMGVVTDSKAPEDPKDPSDTLFSLYLLLEPADLSEMEVKYKNGGVGYKEMKEKLIEEIIRFIAPMRQRREKLAENTDEVLQVLANGGDIARSRARAKMHEVRKRVGLDSTNILMTNDTNKYE